LSGKSGAGIILRKQAGTVGEGFFGCSLGDLIKKIVRMNWTSQFISLAEVRFSGLRIEILRKGDGKIEAK